MNNLLTNNTVGIQQSQNLIQGMINKESSISKINDNELMAVCQDFEAIFVKQMLSSMKNTVSRGGLIDGGMAEEIFEDMLYDKYAEKMSQTAKLGIADMMYKQLAGTAYEQQLKIL